MTVFAGEPLDDILDVEHLFFPFGLLPEKPQDLLLGLNAHAQPHLNWVVVR